MDFLKSAVELLNFSSWLLQSPPDSFEGLSICVWSWSNLEMLSGEQAEKLVSRLSELSTLTVSDVRLLSWNEKESRNTLGSEAILLQKSPCLCLSSVRCVWLLAANRRKHQQQTGS